ncbi:MAG: LysM peptidoglycan-binding domain-containing protein [Flavobacteriaceae bacterium]|nr:LysM peptidoglycan-binding domain-containing protein [Flavobacteriaceae bacterium]
MKRMFLTILGTAFALLSGQQKKHTVVAKENPTTIARKYGVSVDELIKQNPKIKDGKIDIGDVLIIPNKQKNTQKTEEKAEDKKSTEKKSNQKLGKIYLQPKQTIYGITRQYKISEEELRKLNPNLESHMKVGEALVLPEDKIRKYGDKAAQQEVVETPKKDSEEERKTQKLASEDGAYVVQPKDTYYGITRKFNISQSELFALNSGLEQRGLRSGDVIIVKNVESSKSVATTTKDTSEKNTKPKEVKTKTYSVEEYVTHEVKKGESAFGIVNKYNITYDQLAEMNGGLPNGIKQGMVLNIKKVNRQYVKADDDVFSIALILPFGFDTNDTKYRNLSADFLIGAKLAAERGMRDGKKISINVIDAENENSFKNNLAQINKTNTDLIIGPFFKSNVVEVLEYVKNEKIPVVAPFAHTEDLYKYNNLVIVEPGNRVYAERIVREVKNAHSKEKVFIVGEENDPEVIFLKEQLAKELSKTEIVVVSSPSGIELEQNMVTGQSLPAVVILANDNSTVGAGFAKKIIELAKQTEGIKAFSMYYHPDFEKNVDPLSKANLVYLMDRKINTDGDFEKEVLAEFKKEYCRTPSKYTIIGFDVVSDMLARESKGEVLRNMSKVQTQLATKFEYIRTKRNGAFVNTGFRVVRLVP